MTYSFDLLDPRPSADNRAVLARGNLLGLEVTVPALAAACALGNIDPQHSGGDSLTAAIELAANADLPPSGATMVTVRPDADSVGAMAVLLGRAEGGEAWLSQDVCQRIDIIAIGDKEASGDWPGPKPVSDVRHFITPFSVVSGLATDYRLPIAERVQSVHSWLESGRFSGQNALRSRLVEEAEAAVAGLTMVLRPSGIAIVEGNHRLAMSLGYRQAPVVVASNPSFLFGGSSSHLKHTVARWNSAVPMQWDDLRQDFCYREPGWGGSSAILGSPQGVGSQLSTEQVVAMVEARMPARY